MWWALFTGHCNSTENGVPLPPGDGHPHEWMEWELPRSSFGHTCPTSSRTFHVVLPQLANTTLQ